MEQKIVIIGAGPTGLGAGFRLRELGYRNWKCFEGNSYVGGLAASFRDPQGFIWDIGGHVLFSHYKYFDDLFHRLLEGKYLEHQRQSWIWAFERFIPYPFQNNLRYLPREVLFDCLMGLIKTVQDQPREPKNFEEWLLSIFGAGIADHFMFPYNWKNWAVPLDTMDYQWIAERVSVIEVERVVKNLIFELADHDWGPNKTFKFPLYGGTGGLYQKFVPHLKDHLFVNKQVVGIDTEAKKLRFADGTAEAYDMLICTIPINEVMRLVTPAIDKLIEEAQKLVFTSGLIVGLGIKQPCPSEKCWMYFPEANAPFYRVTYFSNYSPHNVPGEDYYSLMCETSYSVHKEVSKTRIIEETIKGLISSKLMKEEDIKDVVSTYLIDTRYTYPVPTIGRDRILSGLNAWLESRGIYSRGRFGIWLYEVGNMDHSVMQGVEIVNRLLQGEPEQVLKPFSFLFS